jgi:competence protein ComEA
VDVDGEVKHPGVYEMAPGARVFQAVDKAGGLKKHADTSGINLAEKVKDGQKISKRKV